MRKGFAILLILGLILNMGGYLLFYNLRLHALKKEMMLRIRSGRDRETLDEFEFALANGLPSEKSFSWEDDENEFHYRGRMYDVVEKSIVNGRLHVIGIEDSKESALLNKMLEIQEKQNGKPAKARPGIQTLLTALFYEESNLNESNLLSNPLLHIDHYCSSWSQVKQEVNTPPPRS